MATTRVQLEEHMSGLREQMNGMSIRVGEDIRKVIVAGKNRDTELARAVRAGDTEINAMQVLIEDRAVQLMATQQPVASDLRELVTIIKVAGELERIADYNAHLAKTIVKLGERMEEEPILAELLIMADKGASMLAQATAAVLDKDEDLARACARQDQGMNDLYRAVVADIIALMKGTPADIQIEARLLRTANSLERLGDHITNICEQVVYLCSGQHVELND